MLTGLGGDELFGGYPLHHTLAWILRARQRWGGLLAPFKGLLGGLERHYPAMKRYRVVGALPTYLPRYYHALLARDEGLRRAQSFDGMVFSDTLRAQTLRRGTEASDRHSDTRNGLTPRSSPARCAAIPTTPRRRSSSTPG